MRYECETICHDHYDGSSHCVECGGDCLLDPLSIAYTALVRSLFEAEALHGQRVAYMTELQMRQSGVDVESHRRRAAEWVKQSREAAAR